jgi:hypothetical protein
VCLQRSVYERGLGFVHEEDVSGILFEAGEQKHSFTSLRKKRQRVDDPVGPAIAAIF